MYKVDYFPHLHFIQICLPCYINSCLKMVIPYTVLMLYFKFWCKFSLFLRVFLWTYALTPCVIVLIYEFIICNFQNFWTVRNDFFFASDQVTVLQEMPNTVHHACNDPLISLDA